MAITMVDDDDGDYDDDGENDGNDADGDGNYGYNDDGNDDDDNDDDDNDDDGNDDNDDDSIYKVLSVGGLGWWSGRASSSCPPKVSEVKGKFEYKDLAPPPRNIFANFSNGKNLVIFLIG